MSFSPAYTKQLLEHYPAEIVDQIVGTPEQAPLPYQPGQEIPFVHVYPIERKHERPILYIPGFVEGINNKASLAAELASQGYEVILPGQNRQGLLKNEHHKRDATYTQARNYLAVAEAAAPNQPLDLVTHSYGSLILNRMVDLDPERFADSRAVALAPAGTIQEETVLTLMRRWRKYITAPVSARGPMEFPDPPGTTPIEGVRTLLSNIIRTALEVRALGRERVNYPKLAQKLGALSVLSHAEDPLFPQELQASTLDDAINAQATPNLSWATPVRYPSADHPEPLTYGGQGAGHDDEQYYPSRVAGAISQILK